MPLRIMHGNCTRFMHKSHIQQLNIYKNAVEVVTDTHACTHGPAHTQTHRVGDKPYCNKYMYYTVIGMH